MSEPSLSRREFLLRAAAGCGALLAGESLLPTLRGWPGLLLGAVQAAPLDRLIRDAPRARYWTSTAAAGCAGCHPAGSLAPGARPAHRRVLVRCQLCARNCTLAEGERGACRARIHVQGELRSLVYGRPITIHVDPIEKKPFFHFLPGASAFSLATSGCPLRCKFCQNWEISQARPEDYDATPQAPAELARAAAGQDAPVIAFTYNEPTVFTEYLTDIARAARPLGRRSVLVSCGFMNEAPLAEMCGVLDAIKIDLKGFSEDFYREVCGAELQPVLRSIRQVARSRTHLELVNLVVPTLNDSPRMLTELSKWVVGEAGPDVPIHFTRFYPDYQLPNLEPTPVASLERARDIAMRQGVHFAYVGNVPGHPGNNTYCPGCGKPVVERDGLFVTGLHLKGGRCAYCGRVIPGVWS
ncbi:MAG TPA: AmmeMemoRadiSam system radical SAM enzyme [Candidatus Saccharimonadales bacterium]|nr:AmmeMemoRadiSam system radical SAM enzyme [Candidatus Saccharimonadales bacterium]